MILHTINKSSSTSSSLERCLQLARPGSAILLFEDGVYSALANTVNTEFLAPYKQRYQFYVLTEDLTARGLAEKIMPEIIPVSYSQFVELSLKYSALQNWA